ncbi:hypothetical protein LCGC14_1589490 [marine sediment metagenome]|uniref:SpoVT-AbrB domain-containing protein n=1 Tax=marine sediment metagenome TaxID=412755 RepID=A0A0F9J0N0_9ZZZZ
MTALPVKRVDGQGRVTLGKAFARQLVTLREVEEGTVEITIAVAIPAREVWLHKNKAALASVMRGLEQTGRGEFAEAPDLVEDGKLADKMGR